MNEKVKRYSYYQRGKRLMKNDIVFQKLTPIDDVKMEVYEDAFRYIFKNKDIKNVAISGPYGAGKSSLLESYKKKHDDKKFLHISLAHFEEAIIENAVETAENTKIDKDTEADKEIEAVLEGKILNQLIQQIEVDNIPQTNFHIKRTVSNSSHVTFSVGTVIFLLAILHLKHFKAWSGWVDSLADSCLKMLLQKLANPYSLLFSGTIAVLILGIAVYQLIKTQKNKNIFRKLSVQGNEIEIFGEDDNSYFDKYLNEVLYLFENSGHDVIVFEDLDRFDDNKIFERLREINILSNIRLKNRKDKKQSEPLRFFYLLRDDIFVNKDRTKFFDFILPVVPVLDSSNAYDQIKSHFEKGGVFGIFEEKFLRGLSLYIDDMRVLKNIYNEFMVYFNKLNTIELNPNKMLAIIAYKNIFPRDFSDLQLNRGFVYELFNRKGEFIEQEKKECEERIESKKVQIENIKNEELKSVQELDYVSNGYYNRWTYSQHTEWKNNEYPLRKKIIEDKLENDISDLEEELILLQEEERTISNKMLHEIITRENVDEIFRISSRNEIGHTNEFKEIKSSGYFALLKFLIRNGYIDESYNDYMTYFYEHSLTKKDKMFLRSISDRVAKPYSYSLDDINLVISNLDISDFEQEEILNFDLFEYLLQYEEEREFLSCFVRQLKKKSKIQFISDFFELNRERTKLVIAVNNQWPKFWGQAAIEHKMTVRQIKEYSVETLENMEGDNLTAVNVDSCLTDYIDYNEDYLAIENPNVTKICNALKTLQVSFKRLNYQVSNKDLFEAVYRNSLYDINIGNIRLILEAEYHIENIEDALRQCISSIFSQLEQPLCKYVQDNMYLLMESILNIPEVEFTDSNTDVIMIINNTDIAETQKVAYIKRLETLIDQLADINEEIYQTELIGKLGVKYTTENILEYFNKVGMTDNLADFINSGVDCLDYRSEEGANLIDSFWKQCISNEKLSLKKYREILLSISPTYSEFTVTGIPVEKMEILIEESFIPMTVKNLTFMRKNYAGIKLKYIISNMAEYVDIAVGNMASAEEVEIILSCDIADETKIKLLSEIHDPISIVDKSYSNKIMAYILKNNLDEFDLPVLYRDYIDYSVEVRHEILTTAKRNIAKIISAPQNISKDIDKELMKDTSINESNRVDLFIAILKVSTGDECKQYLELLGMPEFVKIFEHNRRPKIPIGTVNQKILTALKEAGFIDDFTRDEEESVYKQIRRKTSKTKIPK